MHSTDQQTTTTKSDNASAQMDYALFDRDSEVVVLTPNSKPKPKVLKVEQPDADTIVSEEAQTEELPIVNNEGESSIFTDMGNQLMKLVSPTKKGQKGLRVANLPKEFGGRITRKTAKRTNLKVPDVFGPERSQREKK